MKPQDGSSIIRHNTGDAHYSVNYSIPQDLASATAHAYNPQTLINNYNNPNSPFRNDDRCDILNGIEYQRWVHVTIVGNQRTLDVYIDGKLARSCVYSSYFSAGTKDGFASAYVGSGNNGHLKGYFSNVMYYNYAMSPDAIWSMYQAGPGSPFTLKQFFSNLFSINVTFGK